MTVDIRELIREHIAFDPARYLADPRRLCRGCRIKAGWRVEP